MCHFCFMTKKKLWSLLTPETSQCRGSIDLGSGWVIKWPIFLLMCNKIHSFSLILQQQQKIEPVGAYESSSTSQQLCTYITGLDVITLHWTIYILKTGERKLCLQHTSIYLHKPSLNMNRILIERPKENHKMSLVCRHFSTMNRWSWGANLKWRGLLSLLWTCSGNFHKIFPVLSAPFIGTLFLFPCVSWGLGSGGEEMS